MSADYPAQFWDGLKYQFSIEMSKIKYLACCFSRKYESVLSPPKDIETLFNQYSENGSMKANHFQRFLSEVQCEPKSEEEVHSIMDSYLREKGTILEKLSLPGFTLDSFFGYLFDESRNSAITSTVHQDMTRPISEYFIYTGHNSYLTGNQLSSDCSEKPVVEALVRGVRVIELDIWPNSDDNKVEVKHGGTLTAPVDFEKCIVAIKENAFLKSDYPVVITLEDHLPAHLQDQVAEILLRVCGDTLFYPDSPENFKEFPSPEFLKKRILISTKPPKEYLAGSKNGKSPKVIAEEGEHEQAQKTANEEPWGDELPDFCEDSSAAEKESPLSSEPGFEEDVSDDEETKVPEKRDENQVAPKYKRIITIRAGKPKGTLKDALMLKDNYVKRVSLSEPQLSKVTKANPQLVVSFTQKNLLRIYPYGLRFDSSNYNPLQAWAHGAQMVALNMQGYGRPLWLVHGLFRANGGCGYVKKPDWLTGKSSEAALDLPDACALDIPVKKILKVQIYMGQGWSIRFSKTHFDNFSPPDFYTRVGIAGVKADTIMKKTGTIEDDWIPHWNTEFEFPLRVPELALLRIEVHEYDMSDKDDFGGQTCLPVAELRPGIRTVPLYDKKGRDLIPVRLLVRFDFVTES